MFILVRNIALLFYCAPSIWRQLEFQRRFSYRSSSSPDSEMDICFTS